MDIEPTYEVKIEKSHFQTLPDEILLKIFEHLSTYDIFKRIAPVCNNFNRLSKDSGLIRKIELFNDNAKHTFHEVTEPDYLFEVVERSKNLETLILRNGNDIEQLAVTALQSCPKLRHLEIKNFKNYRGLHLSDYFMETLEKYGQQLHYLDLGAGCRSGHYRNIPFEHIKTREIKRPQLHWSRLLIKLNNLRHLNLECCSGFNSDDLISLAQHCDFLESFVFDVPKLQFQPVIGPLKDAFDQFFEKRKFSLKCLFLSGLQIELIEYVPICFNLEELEIGEGANLEERRMRSILQSKYLKRLKLHYITVESFIALFSSNNLSHLTQLEFHLSTFSFNLEHVLDQKLKLSNLKKLNITLPAPGFYEDDFSMPNFVKILVQNCPNLESLEIVYFSKQRIGGLNYLSHLQNLKELNIVSTVDKMLASSQIKLENMKEFNFPSTNISTSDLCTIFDRPNWNLIDLSIPYVDEKILKAIAKHCPNVKNLTILDQVHELYTIPGGLHNLKTLKIWSDSNDFIGIFSNEKLKELLKLEIMSQINDKELEIIACNCPNLEYLKLTNLDKISDRGIKSVLLNCGNIEELHLNDLHGPYGNFPEGITEHFINEICCENVPKLQLLNLNKGPKISDIVLKNLIDKIKHLKVINAENKLVESKKWIRLSK